MLKKGTFIKMNGATRFGCEDVTLHHEKATYHMYYNKCETYLLPVPSWAVTINIETGKGRLTR